MPFGAGGTGADADPMILQNVDSILHGNPGNGDGQYMGGFMDAIYGDALQSGKSLDGGGNQRFFPDGIFLHGGADGSTGGGEAENGGVPSVPLR